MRKAKLFVRWSTDVDHVKEIVQWNSLLNVEPATDFYIYLWTHDRRNFLCE